MTDWLVGLYAHFVLRVLVWAGGRLFDGVWIWAPDDIVAGVAFGNETFIARAEAAMEK